MRDTQVYRITFELPGVPPVTVTIPIGPGGVPPIVATSPPAPPDLSDTEQAILDLLRASRRRLTSMQLVEQLDRAGQIVSESTVRKAATALVKRGLVSSSRKKPYGYVAL